MIKAPRPVDVKCNHTRLLTFSHDLLSPTLPWGTLTGGARQHGRVDCKFELTFMQTGQPYQSGR